MLKKIPACTLEQYAQAGLTEGDSKEEWMTSMYLFLNASHVSKYFPATFNVTNDCNLFD